MRSRSYISSVARAVDDTNEISGGIGHTLHPSDPIESVLEQQKELIKDSKIKIEVDHSYSYVPPKISDYSSDSIPFQVIANSALEIYKDGKIVPGPMGGPNYGMATDSGRHYWNLTDNIYRFSPIVMTREETKMHHGKNEKISIENYSKVCYTSSFLSLV